MKISTSMLYTLMTEKGWRKTTEMEVRFKLYLEAWDLCEKIRKLDKKASKAFREKKQEDFLDLSMQRDKQLEKLRTSVAIFEEKYSQVWRYVPAVSMHVHTSKLAKAVQKHIVYDLGYYMYPLKGKESIDF
jgi:hypothetical protein